ncbi:MAG: glycosyltransferase [Pyrinomonadaceae bacterium]|nr:glycosyltransferase [Pyrinomonadaceae bacterium]
MTLEGRRALFISYNGMLDPLGQSQVLPYLRELAKRGVRFTLLSFERAPAFEAEGRASCEQLRASLAAENIEWHRLRYHAWPSLPATSFDVLRGVNYARRLVRRNKIEMVHARSHIPATIALALKRRFGIKMIFDIRGLMAEEYFDAGHWRKESIAYRLTKRMERRALAATDGVVTLTERIWPIIKEWKGLQGREVVHEVVPCCTDLEVFRFSAPAREQRRRELKLGNRFVLVYSGSIDGWYLTEEMVKFFVTLRKTREDAHSLWLTPSRHDRIRDLMTIHGIDPNDFTVLRAHSHDVPSYLSASDAGIALIKPCFSKLASSPTKNAEYLGCGLPLIINSGIGDSDTLITQENTGVLLRGFKESDYAAASASLKGFVDNSEKTRQRNRDVAERNFDLRVTGVSRYTSLYEKLFQPIKGT